MNNENIVNEEVIRYLPFPLCIRQRVSMYLDVTTDSSQAFRELVDNSTDEIGSGFGDTVLVYTDFNGYKYVSDNGRGIPCTMSIDKPNQTQTRLAITTLHSGSKFDVTNTSRVGMNGVGMSCCNAVADQFIILSKITETNYNKSIPEVQQLWESNVRKRNLFYIIVCERGEVVFEGAGKLRELEKLIFKNVQNYRPLPDNQSTIMLFKPDPTIFEKCTALPPIKNLQYFLLIQEKFFNRKVNVIVDDIVLKNTFKPYQFEVIRTIVPQDTSKNQQVNVYLTFDVDPLMGKLTEYGSINGLDCNGYHMTLAKNLYKTALKDYFKIKHDYLLDGLNYGIIVLAADVNYSGQTKESCRAISKVKSEDFLPIVKDIEKIFRKYEDYWAVHVDKLNKLAEAHINIGAVEKAKRMIDSGNGVSLYRSKNDLVPGFVDATSQDRSKCSLWIVEGLSPGSSLVNSRLTPAYDSVLPIRGKVLNVMDKSADQALDNKEIYSIFSAIKLGIDAENVTKGCTTLEEAQAAIASHARYSKIILAVDPDPDGYFIANSLLYLFSKFARFLLDFGLVYVIEVPVFIQEQNGVEKFFYPSDPVIPGTILPVGLDLNKRYTHIKGLGSLSKEQVQKSFFSPDTRRLIRITTEQIEKSRTLTEDIKYRKKFLFDTGIISNPFNFNDIEINL